MPPTCTLLLVAAAEGGRAARERVAALPRFTRDARGFSVLYTAEDPCCIALAEHIGDRLWMSPRGLFGLGTPHALLELARSHRYERIVVVAPAQRLELALSWLRAYEPRAQITQLERTPAALFELSMVDVEVAPSQRRAGEL